MQRESWVTKVKRVAEKVFQRQINVRKSINVLRSGLHQVKYSSLSQSERDLIDTTIKTEQDDREETKRIMQSVRLGLFKTQNVFFNPDKFVFNRLAYRMKYGKLFESIVSERVQELENGASPDKAIICRSIGNGRFQVADGWLTVEALERMNFEGRIKVDVYV